ncbi:MAG: F0F1 ATP synthase subunit delta [Bacillota bacterium]
MTEGELITSMPLDDDTKEYIAREFEKMLGAPVRFKTRIDDSILGGFIAVINGRVYDGSVLASMKTLKEFITDF